MKENKNATGEYSLQRRKNTADPLSNLGLLVSELTSPQIQPSTRRIRLRGNMMTTTLCKPTDTPEVVEVFST